MGRYFKSTSCFSGYSPTISNPKLWGWWWRDSGKFHLHLHCINLIPCFCFCNHLCDLFQGERGRAKSKGKGNWEGRRGQEKVNPPNYKHPCNKLPHPALLQVIEVCACAVLIFICFCILSWNITPTFVFNVHWSICLSTFWNFHHLMWLKFLTRQFISSVSEQNTTNSNGDKEVQPYILALNNPTGSPQYYLKADWKTIHVGSCPLQALALLVKFCYVFDRSYDIDIKHFYVFIEFVFGLSSGGLNCTMDTFMRRLKS